MKQAKARICSAFWRTGFGGVAVESSQKVADADEDVGVPAENFSSRLGGSVRGLRRRRCGGPPLSEGSGNFETIKPAGEVFWARWVKFLKIRLVWIRQKADGKL